MDRFGRWFFRAITSKKVGAVALVLWLLALTALVMLNPPRGR